MNDLAQPETISADDATGSGLFLNAAVLDFGDATVEADVLPRIPELTELSRKHRATHVLRAEGDEILAVPIVENAPRLSENRRTLTLRDYPGVACNLWREALLRRMVARKRPIVRGKPVQVLSTATSDQVGPGEKWVSKSTHPKVVRAIDARVAYSFWAQVFRPPASPNEAAAVPVIVLEISIEQRISASVTEQAGVRTSVLDDVREVVRTHYVLPEIAAQRVADLGAPATAKILRELLPKTKAARSGDFGEVLATEVAEQTLGVTVPVRRLRWKDGRNMALRGDDIVGVRVDKSGKLIGLLKGESKSYARLTDTVIEKAAEALDRDRGRPGRHAVLFIATRLRETGKDADAALAAQLEAAVVAGFSSSAVGAVEQFLFALTGIELASLQPSHRGFEEEATETRGRRADR